MYYRKPIQARAIETEQRFLQALDTLLQTKSFAKLTIDDLSNHTGLHRAAFLKRFRTKKNALFALFDQYCQIAIQVMNEFESQLDKYPNDLTLLFEMSTRLEAIQRASYSANRAMYEDFIENLETHPLTKNIFLRLVALNYRIQDHFYGKRSEVGAFAAAQLLVSVNYHYVFQAMPGLPRNAEIRHQLIAKITRDALLTHLSHESDATGAAPMQVIRNTSDSQ